MPVDLEAIRRRVQELSGARRNSNIQMWKPGIGEYKVRGLPWKSMSSDGMPFVERWFYYIGNERGFLSPKQFGKTDPIDDFIRKLYASGKPEDRAIAKKLGAKMRTYMPVIVRGEEDKGVQVWAFGKPVYQRLLSFFTESDIGDILDPHDGWDLKVSITHQAGKMFNGKPSLDTTIDVARRSSKLSDDADQLKEWVDAVPNLDDMYKQKSQQEIETILNNYMNGDPLADGTESGGESGADELDKLAADIDASKMKTQTEAAKAVTSKKPTAKKPTKPAADVDDVKVASVSLDEAFDSMMDDEDDS